MNTTRLTLPVLASLIFATPVYAEKPSTYVFFDALHSNITTDIADRSSIDSARDDAATANWSIDPTAPAFDKDSGSDTDSGFRIGGGLDISPNWGMAITFAVYGEGINTLSGVGGDIEVATKVRAASLELLRYFPIYDQFRLYGKLGVDAWTAEIRARQAGKAADKDKDSGYMPTVGVGARYALGDNIDVSAELAYRRYDAEYSQYETRRNPADGDDLDVGGRYTEIETDIDVTSFSIGIGYRF